MLEILVAVAAPPSSVTLFVSMQLFDKRLLTIHQPKASFHTPPRLYSEPIQDWAFRFRFWDRLMASFRWVSVHSPATSHPQVCLNRWCNMQFFFRQRVLIEYGSIKATIIKPKRIRVSQRQDRIERIHEIFGDLLQLPREEEGRAGSSDPRLRPNEAETPLMVVTVGICRVAASECRACFRPSGWIFT